ncbi:hypothetical protein Acy02nite_81150 [Actinoplanes cyaneus]|uniref:Uncharacterized protein n=1 Tax=Actinoplanes cyaneus TaxID=52696 RepID=A0A919MC26_9ACTN|nr:hypothetical protein [Actinoplanes cyaneus]GID70234.1 hypothetical protein Acy02nite_81150 [Actinoplanes cyaneus]
MTRTVRSRRAGVANQPLYARALRLRHLSLGGLLCFVFLEGAFALGVLLALAELVSWWGVLLLPAAVAVMVKFNDLVAGWLAPPARTAEPVAARAVVSRERHTHRPRSGGHSEDWPRAGAQAGEWSPPPRVRKPVVPPPVDTGARSTGVVWFPPENGYGRRSTSPEMPSEPGQIVNTAPARRPWSEDLDVRQQMARQSAVRRYE